MGNPRGYTGPTNDRGKYLRVEPEVRLRKSFEEGAPGSCWPWKARLDRHGYGRFWTGERLIGAHRAVYELVVGPIPKGLTLDHLCHTRDEDCEGGPTCMHRRCVNPAHLEPVTLLTNKRRGKSPPSNNALKTECPQGHPLSGENLLVRRENGWRRCRTCVNESNRRAYEKRRGKPVKKRKSKWEEVPFDEIKEKMATDALLTLREIERRDPEWFNENVLPTFRSVVESLTP